MSERVTVAITYDLACQEGREDEAFEKTTRLWLDSAKKARGYKEGRRCKNSFGLSPQVLVQHEFEDVRAARAYQASRGFVNTAARTRALGSTNLVAQTWSCAPSEVKS